MKLLNFLGRKKHVEESMSDTEMANILYKTNPKNISYEKRIDALLKYYKKGGNKDLTRKELESNILFQAKSANSTKDKISMLLIIRIRAEAMEKVKKTIKKVSGSNKNKRVN